MSRLLHAVSGDSCCESLFQPGYSGHVHSVFPRVVNLVDPDNVLYSIASYLLDNAPHTVRVRISQGFSFDKAGISSGDQVWSERGLLSIGDELAVEAAGAEGWQPVLPSFVTGSQLEVLQSNLILLRNRINAVGVPGGLKGCCQSSQQEISTTFNRELSLRTASLMTALETSDFGAALGYGRSLLGLGTGQTPSGDDFLCGLLTVFHLPGAPFGAEYIRLGQRLAIAAKQLTGDISQAMLEHAAVGQVRESIIELTRKLMEGKTGEVEAAADRVLTIGSASGTDIAVGLATGFEHGLLLLGKQAKGG